MSLVEDLFESEISLEFDQLLHDFEKYILKNKKKNKIENFPEPILIPKRWLEAFAGFRDRWLWLLGLPEREYCFRIKLFTGCLQDYFNGYLIEDWLQALRKNPFGYLPEILTRLTMILQSPRYKRIASDIKYEVKKRNISLEENIRALIGRQLRTLAIRFELYYVHEYVKEITSIELRQHIKDFTQEIKKPKNFIFVNHQTKYPVELKFYARVIEQGGKQGHFHSHFIVLLNGKYHLTDKQFIEGARCIWDRVTQGKGYLYQHKPKKDDFMDRNYINGKIIEREDKKSIDLLIEAAEYIGKNGIGSKTDQYLRIKPLGFEPFACSHG